MDAPLQGNLTLKVSALPTLYNVVYRAAKVYFTELIYRVALAKFEYLYRDCLLIIKRHKTHNKSYYSSSIGKATSVLIDIQLVDNPVYSERSAGRATLFDTWSHYYPSNSSEYLAKVQLPNAGSDHNRFLSYIGMPVVNLRVQDAPNASRPYPLYHSRYV